jgi:DNA invertase Pin-like site-specific DNA recombinase
MRAAIYARVSTIDKQNYDRQISDLTPIIEKHGISKDNIEIFGENISGYKAKEERPEFSRLLNLIASDPTYFSCVYVTEISRLGRSPKEARETVDHLIKVNVPIYVKTINQKTINDDGTRNSIMSIILQVLMEFAHLESEQMKERSKSGLLQSARNGKAGGGYHQPYGYTKDDNGMLVIEDTEAEIIKDIFQLYKEGNGTKVISGILNERKVPTKSQISYSGKTINYRIPKKADNILWSDKVVIDILANTLYKGKRAFKEHIFDAPAIISEELFDECTMIRESKTHRNYETTYTYLLKDIIKCGCCGNNYMAKYKPTPNGDKVYICTGRLKGKNCGNAGINISLLESAIFHQILSSEGALKFLESTDNIKKELEKDIKRLEAQLKVDEVALNAKDAEKKRLLSVFVGGHISEEDFVSTNKELETQLINLNSKVSLVLESVTSKKITLSKQKEGNATRKMLFDARNNRTEMATLIKQIIKKVIINKITDDYVMATLILHVHGYQLKGNFPLVLHTKGMRFKNKKYEYIQLDSVSPFDSSDIHQFDDNDVFQGDINLVQTDLNVMLNYYEWLVIPDDNILLVEPLGESS